MFGASWAISTSKGKRKLRYGFKSFSREKEYLRPKKKNCEAAKNKAAWP